MLCSITRSVIFSASASAQAAAIARSASDSLMPDVGSSMRSSAGRAASARARSIRFSTLNGTSAATVWRYARRSKRSSTANASRAAWSSRGCASGVANAACASGTCEWRPTPTRTLSNTESSANGSTCWNVRPMPRRLIACAGSPDTDKPSNSTRPPAIGTVPVIALINVVFPAPFGPMSPRISPVATRSETSRTAIRPPKRTDTRSTVSRSVTGAPRRPRPAHATRDHLPDRHESVRQEDQEPEQHQRIDDVAVLFHGAQRFGHRAQHRGADHRAAHRPHSTYDDEGDLAQRCRDTELDGIDEADDDRLQSAGDAGISRGQRECRELHAVNGHAERLGGVRTQPNRVELTPYARCEQIAGGPDRQHAAAEHDQ